jgi:signal transduction histidine kinase/putative methionine-R-sulfoxide reductase with GAF domain
MDWSSSLDCQIVNENGQLLDVIRQQSFSLPAEKPQLPVNATPATNTDATLQQALENCTTELHQSQQDLQRVTQNWQAAETALHEYERISELVQDITLDICRTPELETILKTAVHRIIQLLQVDRVCIYKFQTASDSQAFLQHSTIVEEALSSNCISMLGFLLGDPILSQATYLQQYRQGQVVAIADVQATDLEPEIIDLLTFFQIRAKLVVPILQQNSIWGLLALHQTQPRQWHPREIYLLKQLVTHLSIAIQQVELYQKIQNLNVGLESQIQERTEQFQRALDLEAILKRITDKVRDSLDEHQILQTALQELMFALGSDRCVAVLYGAQAQCKVCYECTATVPQMHRKNECVGDFAVFSQQLCRGECVQYCDFSPYLNRSQEAVLICSIFEDEEVIGDLRLYAQRSHGFSDLEVRVVQQVANQCAIAIRQARLYQASQAQVRELEALNHLKNDFLSTISHELRTPLSSIKMAIEMLELSLAKDDSSSSLTLHPSSFAKVDRYLKILRDECDREISLINNVLTLQQLEAGLQTLLPTAIKLQEWLPQVAEVFEEQAQGMQQRLKVEVSPGCPALVSDLFMLDHILAELLTNACKFTPQGETITVSANAAPDAVLIHVCSSGIEIPPTEWLRIFDKFYRIPSADPWRRGGTGLGLALVKKLTERLGGQVWVESGAGLTCFTVQLPLTCSSARSV